MVAGFFADESGGFADDEERGGCAEAEEKHHQRALHHAREVVGGVHGGSRGGEQRGEGEAAGEEAEHESQRIPCSGGWRVYEEVHRFPHEGHGGRAGEQAFAEGEPSRRNQSKQHDEQTAERHDDGLEQVDGGCEREERAGRADRRAEEGVGRHPPQVVEQVVRPAGPRRAERQRRDDRPAHADAVPESSGKPGQQHREKFACQGFDVESPFLLIAIGMAIVERNWAEALKNYGFRSSPA